MEPVVETPVTEPVVEAPVTEPTAIISLEDLMNTHDVIVSKETEHKQVLTPLVTPNEAALKPTLFQWARSGFPPIFPVLSLYVDPPQVCSDGVSRPCFEYVEYLLEDTIGNKIAALQTKLPGMQLSYSTSGSCVTVHVSKA